MTAAPEGVLAPGVQQQVAGDHNVFTGMGDVYVVRHEAVPPPDRAVLRDLREKVRQFWVRGVLESSLHGKSLLALGKATMPEAVEHPWGRVLELPDGTQRTVDAGTTALRLYEDASRMLLVLGEPGSGKTTTLLELARDLIAEAEADESRPVPVVLNLATWAQSETAMEEWIASELAGKYGAPRKLAKRWLEHGGLVLLLDGLDEVAEERRAACVGAINEYLNKVGVPGMCLCSRLREYTELPARVRLNRAVRLEPLTDVQVSDYVAAAREKLAGFGEALRSDPVLREAARSPLMLSIMSLAYEGAPVGDVAAPELATAQARRAHAFHAYVGHMFRRRGQVAQMYEVRETVRWLHWLAQGMKKRSQTVFLIEGLQPDWLPRRMWRIAYALVSRSMAGIVYMAGAIIASRGRLPFLVYLGVSGGGVGLADAIRFGFGTAHDANPLSAWHRVVRSAVYALISSVSFVVVHAVTVHALSLDVAPVYVLLGGLFGVIYGWRSDALGAAHDIRTTERLRWSWKSAKTGIGAGFLFGGIPLACFFALFWTQKHESNMIAAINVFFGGILLGLIAAAIGAVYWGFVARTIETKVSPNEGITLTLRNALLVLLVGEGVWASIGVPATWSGGNTINAMAVGLIFASPGALSFGGIDVIQHYILRLMLAAKGLAPLRLARFLDHCATLVFLQKVGGGYVFVHRLLLEHFAESPVDRGA